jgi:hypothetical protein
MQGLNKRAVSDIVAIVLIISLSLIAVSLVFAYLKPLILDLSPEFDCTKAKLKQALKIESACYDPQTNDVVLEIERKFDKNIINRIDFSIQSLDNSNEKFYCGENCNGALLLNPGETKKYFFETSGIPSSISISVRGCFLDTSEIKQC